MLVSFPFKRNQTIQLTPEHQLQLPDSDHHLCSPVPPPHLPHGPHNLYSHSFKKNSVYADDPCKHVHSSPH